MEDVDFTVLAATSVLGDLIEKCPPAEACRDAFKRMSNATIRMCLESTGFGSAVRADAGSESEFGTGDEGYGYGDGGNGSENAAWVQVSYDQPYRATTAAAAAMEETSPLMPFSQPLLNNARAMPPPPRPAPPSSTAVPPIQQKSRFHDPPSTIQFEGLSFLREGNDDAETGPTQTLDPDPGNLDLDQSFGAGTSIMDWESEFGGGHGYEFSSGNGGVSHLDMFDGFFFGNSGGL